jgi:hypothetical protein
MSNIIRAIIVTSGLIGYAQIGHSQTMTVMHPAPEPPSYLDFEPVGIDSAGDMRLFHFAGRTGDDTEVVMNWIMTTTGVGAVEGANARVTQAVFSIGGHGGDQIIVLGAGLYPDASNIFSASSSLTRSIIGGTGEYAGASGVVVSTHKADGSWTHEFHFEN